MYHLMVHNDTLEVAKSCKIVAPTFYCDKCDFATSRKSSWKKHLETRKHNDTQMIHNGTSEVAKSCTSDLESQKWVCICGKSYKYHSGYYRHKSKCTYKAPVCEPVCEVVENKEKTYTPTQVTQITTQVITSLLESGALGQQQGGHHNTINNNHQKIFNVNLFLNEQCANAMSIQDFAKNLQLTMNDLDKSKPECITNVVLKNLRPMAITDRPIHCTDGDKQEWYVKDQEKGWQEDDGDTMLATVDNTINRKWPSTFQEEHPNFASNEKLQEKYIDAAAKASKKLSDKAKKKVLSEIGVSATLNADVIEKS